MLPANGAGDGDDGKAMSRGKWFDGAENLKTSQKARRIMSTVMVTTKATVQVQVFRCCCCQPGGLG